MVLFTYVWFISLCIYLSLNSIFRVCMLVGYCFACHLSPLFYASLLTLNASVRDISPRAGLKLVCDVDPLPWQGPLTSRSLDCSNLWAGTTLQFPVGTPWTIPHVLLWNYPYATKHQAGGCDHMPAQKAFNDFKCRIFYVWSNLDSVTPETPKRA